MSQEPKNGGERPTINVELRGAPMFVDNAGAPMADRGAQVREWLDAIRKAERNAGAAFLRERLEPLPDTDKPTADEQEALRRLLQDKAEAHRLQIRPPGTLLGVRPAVLLADMGAVRPVFNEKNTSAAAQIDARVAVGDALVCAELDRLRESTAQNAERLAAGYPNSLPLGAVMPPDAPNWFLDLVKKATAKTATMLELEDLPSGWVDPGLAHRVHLALIWPEVWHTWRDENAPTLAARRVLAQEKDLANEAEALLTSATRGALAKARRELGALPTGADLVAVNEATGLLWVTERHAAYLEKALGAESLAAGLRTREHAEGAEQSIDAWRDSARFATVLAKHLWDSDVRPTLEREAERERGVVRVGTDIASTWALARVVGGRSIEHEGTPTILVAPPSGTALMLPFDDGLQVTKGSGGLVGLRQVLTPRAQRTYLATLVLYQDQGMREDGTFSIAGPSSILEVTGATRHEDKKTGRRTYYRYATKDSRAVGEDLELFSRIRARFAGDLEAVGGDPLIDELRDRRSGRTAFYAHSRLVVGQLHNNYFRIPRAVCRLPTNDIPLALGLAKIARGGMVKHLAAGTPIEAPIFEVLEAAGVNTKDHVRKHGLAFWPTAATDLARVAEEGKLGTVRVVGNGRDLVITLEPDTNLRASYAPLLDAANAQRRAKQAARVADHRKTKKK